ncbi:MAG TPA: hypothetical protein VGB07_34240, partial [Blastocatellia bacterium]
MKNIRHLVSLALIFCLAVVPAFAQAAAPATATASTQAAKPKNLAELQSRIAALLDQPKFAAARWGIFIKAGQSKIV